VLPGEKEFNQCSKLPPGKRIKLTLKPETELNDLLGWISGLTCTQFILPASVRSQKVTIISPVPITSAEAYRLFLGALESIGLTVVPTGGFLKIVEIAKAKEGVPTYRVGEDAPSDSRFITRLVRVKYVDVEQAKAIVNALKSNPGGDVQSFASSKTLIITDVASNIRRIMEVLDDLDQEGSAEKVWVVKLKHSTVQDVSAMVSEILGVSVSVGTQGAKKGGTPTPAAAPRPGIVPGQPGSSNEPQSRLIIDERSNQLFVVASEGNYQRIKTLILRLDRAVETVEGPEGRVHVYPLENADVDEISGTLQGLTGLSVTRSTVARRGLSGSTAAPAPPPSPAAPAGQRTDSQMLFSGDISIAADRATNSLVILSSPQDYYTLLKIIKKLDMPRRQVFVEATIMEISMDKTRDLGLSFHGGTMLDKGGSNQSLLIFGNNAAKTVSPSAGIIGDPLALQGLAAGVFGPELGGAGSFLNLPGVSIPSFGAFMMALQRNNDVNVLSTPFIMTTDNEEAEISVGQNLPFPGALTAGLGGLGGGAAGGAAGLLGQTSVQRQDVALRLKLKPHVNENGFVRLEIDQEISDISSPNFNGLGPATSKRTAKTMLTVRDQQTVVIGGLVSDRVLDRISKIPILGDIPILGYLFKQTTHSIEKRNLMIILTPYVITDQQDLKRIVERKMRERREFLERYTAVEDKRDVEAHVDYARRRGFFEEINVTYKEQVAEEKVLADTERGMAEEAVQTPIPLPAGGADVRGGHHSGQEPSIKQPAVTPAKPMLKGK
jgi:general secretion pathway protein D